MFASLGLSLVLVAAWLAPGNITPPEPALENPVQAQVLQVEPSESGVSSTYRQERRSWPDTPSENRPASAGGAVTSGVVRVEVFLEDDRSPAEGVTVALVPTRNDGERLARTNKGGFAEFRGVPEGRVVLRCVGGGGEREVDVRPGTTSECWFEITRARAVVRVQQRDGMPIPGALVRVSRSRIEVGVPVGYTDISGQVELFPVSGHVLVEASADRFGPSGRIDVPISLQRTITLEPGGGALRLAVRDRESGLGVRGAVVTFGRPSSTSHVVGNRLYPSGSPRVGTTDGDGTILLSGLRTGGGQLSVRARGYATWHGGVEVRADGTEAFLEVELAKQVTLACRVAYSGDPVANAEVTLIADGQSALHTYSAPDGSVFFTGLSPGVYNLEALKHQVGRCALEVLVPSEQTVEVELSGAWSIEGAVMDSAGHPLAGARVGVWELDGNGGGVVFYPQTTSASGRFHVLVEDSRRTVELAVMYPAGATFPSLRRTVPLGRMDLSLSVSDERKASSYIKAGLSGSLRVQSMDSGASVLASPPKDGREVLIGPMPPGEYRVEHVLSLQHITTVGEYLLSAGNTLELGWLD